MSSPLFSGTICLALLSAKHKTNEPRQTKNLPWLEQPKVVMVKILSGEMLKEMMAPSPEAALAMPAFYLCQAQF